MSVAAKPGSPPLAPQPGPELTRAMDDRRMPKVRVSMHLIVPRVVTRNGVKHVAEAKLTVTEQRATVRLVLDVDNDGLGVKAVELALPEVCALSDMLNRVRHKVANRKGYAP